MAKYNFNKSTTKVQWLSKDAYPAFAMALISSVTNDEDTDVNALAQQISKFRDGETTSKGKTVYLKYLLGAIKQISPELCNDIMSIHNGTSSDNPKSVNDF